MTKYLSCADTAKLVRAALKAAFPGIKFSVRSDTYSGGASIRVSWTDGPTVKAVEAVTNRYRGADFDGMQDLKTYRSDTLLALPDGTVEAVHFGADYIFGERKLSDAYLAELEPYAVKMVYGNGGGTFDRGRWYDGLACEHGVFPNGSGHNLLWWLSNHIAPSAALAPAAPAKKARSRA